MGTTSLLVLKQIAGNSPTGLYPMQSFMQAHIEFFTGFWVALWCATAIALLWRLVSEYVEQQEDE